MNLVAGVSRARVCSDIRGAAATEYIAVLSLVGLIALSAYASLGGAVGDRVRCAASALAGGSRCAPAARGAAMALEAPSAGVNDRYAAPVASRGTTAALTGESETESERASESETESESPPARTAHDVASRAERCSGISLCQLGRAWDIGTSTVGWVASAAQRTTWLAGVPLVLPGQWDDFVAFQTNIPIGVGEWIVGLGTGLYRAGEWLVDRHVRALDAIRDGDWGEVLTLATGWDIVSHPGAIVDVAGAIVTGLWHEIDTFAAGDPDEAGRAAGGLALDVASVVVPAGLAARGARGTAIAAAGTDAARVGEIAGVVEDGAAVTGRAVAGRVISPDPAALARFAHLEGEAGVVTVVVPASGNGSVAWISRGGDIAPISHRALADWLRANGWDGSEVRLVMSGGASSPHRFAQHLANDLGARVHATPTTVWPLEDAAGGTRHVVGPHPNQPSGEWLTFSPGERPYPYTSNGRYRPATGRPAPRWDAAAERQVRVGQDFVFPGERDLASPLPPHRAPFVRARSVTDLYDALGKVSSDSVARHASAGDFSTWAREALHDDALAASLRTVEETSASVGPELLRARLRHAIVVTHTVARLP